jgi:mycothiol synthase
MIELRRVESDADLEAFRRVRMEVEPNERSPTVEELRDAIKPDSLFVLAELDGELAGAGFAGRSDLAGRAGFIPRVVPERRRRGVGTALVRALAGHVQSLGYEEVGTRVEDPGALAFAERFGFREVDRQVEQVWLVAEVEALRVPDGVEIVSVADRPELWRAAYDEVGKQAFHDFALDTPLDISREQWEREWINWPEATFVALAGGDVIGCAGLLHDADQEDRAENALTAVRRDWRRRGVALTLKRTTMAFAAARGLREVYTWTQRGNDDMRRLNERLGYIYRGVSISLRAPLPLQER